MKPDPPTICVELLFKRFRHREVLKGVYFAARADRVTALLGRNGSGKSTLLKILAGVMRCDSGRLAFEGRAVATPRLQAMARLGLAYLPQEDLLLPHVPVHIQLECFSNGANSDAVMQSLGLDRGLCAKPIRLSGGERRRCELAAVLLTKPQCLLADEPFTGLAPVDAERIARCLRDLAKGGCAVVITDHSVEWALGIADDVWLVDSGTCRYVGPTREALYDHDLQRCYLGTRAERIRSELPAGDLVHSNTL